MRENPLRLLMNPGSIAIVGANNNPSKMGTMHALSILKDGYTGAFYPVHPTEKMILGHKAYARAAALPEVPDLLFVVVPSSAVAGVFEEFGAAGTRRAVVITAGFKELGQAGKKMEDEINATAAKYDMRFTGPNCMGILNTEISLNTTVLVLRPGRGLLGMASQSGTYVTQALEYLYGHGIRFSKAISVGNEANVNIIDALEYLGEDEQTKAISLYIESIRDIPRFLEVARKITPRKPVIAQYIGGTEAGARSGLSHTGALAGPDHLYDGLFKQAGVIRVDSVEDLYGIGWALAASPRLKGKRVGIITNSGGPGSAMATTLEKGGLEVPVYSASLQEKMKPLVPPHAPTINPVDLTFSTDMKIITGMLPELVMQSGEVDAVIMHGAMRAGWMKAMYPHIREIVNNMSIDEYVTMFRDDSDQGYSLSAKYGIPMTVSCFFGREDDIVNAYCEYGVPVYDVPEKAARALVAQLRYMEITQRKPPVAPEIPSVSSEARKIIDLARSQGRGALDEFEAKRLMACYGIPVSEGRLVATAEAAAGAAAEMGYPVTVKACHAGIMHKTERGLVHIGCGTAASVKKAFADIGKKAGAGVPVLVSRMVEGRRELVAGMTRAEGFPPCVLFGLGGIYTEALHDTSFRMAPLSREEAEEMLDDIRAKNILGDFRGMPAADRGALAALLQNLGFVALLHPEIAEIDLNPVIISGSMPVAVDALIVLKQDDE